MATIESGDQSLSVYAHPNVSSAYPSERILFVGTDEQVGWFNRKDLGIDKDVEVDFSYVESLFYYHFFRDEEGKITIPKKIITTGEMRFSARETRNVSPVLEEIAEKWGIPIGRVCML